jgi:glycogen operon protein
VLQHRRFVLGKDLDADGVPDLTWFDERLGRPRWDDHEARTLCMQLDTSDAHGGAVPEAHRLYFIINAHWERRVVQLPRLGPRLAWHRAIDTSLPPGQDFAAPGAEVRVEPADHYLANGRSSVMLIAR